MMIEPQYEHTQKGLAAFLKMKIAPDGSSP